MITKERKKEISKKFENEHQKITVRVKKGELSKINDYVNNQTEFKSLQQFISYLIFSEIEKNG